MKIKQKRTQRPLLAATFVSPFSLLEKKKTPQFLFSSFLCFLIFFVSLFLSPSIDPLKDRQALDVVGSRKKDPRGAVGEAPERPLPVLGAATAVLATTTAVLATAFFAAAGTTPASASTFPSSEQQ